MPHLIGNDRINAKAVNQRKWLPFQLCTPFCLHLDPYVLIPVLFTKN